MNILENLEFNPDKIAKLVVRQSDKVSILAIGLLEDQVLKEHKTNIPTLFYVHMGRFRFTLEGKDHLFDEGEAFQIPVDKLHEVRGMKGKNVFLLVQEKG